MLIDINFASRHQPGLIVLDLVPVADGSARVGVCLNGTNTGITSVHVAAAPADTGREHPPADQLPTPSGARSAAPLVLVSIGLFACALVLASALFELGL